MHIGVLNIRGQVVSTLPEEPESDDIALVTAKDPEPQVLPQANLSFSDSSPQVSVSILKYYLGLSDNIAIPLYLLSSLPAQSEISVDNTVSSLLDEFGGRVNFALGFENKRLTPFGLFKFKNKQHGLFAEGRLGAKVIEVANSIETDTKMIGFTQAMLNARLHLPIWGASDKKTRAGDLVGLLSAGINYSTNDTYKSLFVDEPPSALFFLNLNGALNITNALSISGGITLLTNDDNIDSRTFFSLTVLSN